MFNINKLTMNLKLIDLVIGILFLIFIYCLYINCSKSNNEEYLDYKNYQKLNSNLDCFDYLTFDGVKYNLINFKIPYQKGVNPLHFNTYQEAYNYLSQNDSKCQDVVFVNLVVDKNNVDTRDEFRKECNKEFAPFFKNANSCQRDYEFKLERSNLLSERYEKENPDNMLLSNNDLNQKKEIYKNKIKNLQSISDNVDYKIEKCMMEKILKENQELNNQSPHFNNERKFMNEINTFF